MKGSAKPAGYPPSSIDNIDKGEDMTSHTCRFNGLVEDLNTGCSLCSHPGCQQLGPTEPKITAASIGVAIHKARDIGGPWSPCPYDYNTGDGEFECECLSMGTHLYNLITVQPFDHIDWCSSNGPYLAPDCDCPGSEDIQDGFDARHEAEVETAVTDKPKLTHYNWRFEHTGKEY